MSVTQTQCCTKDPGTHSLTERHLNPTLKEGKNSCNNADLAVKVQPKCTSKSSSLREEFIKALRVSDKSNRTIKSYCDAVKMFQNFIHKNPLDVTVNDIRAFFFT